MGHTCHGCGGALPPRSRKWCSERCRRLTLYSRRCVDCGAVCNTDGRVAEASERCWPCHKRLMHESRRWTRESIVAAIRLWADQHGGVPPKATDCTGLAREPGGADFPYVGSVQQEFGTWRAAILAAGFDAFRVGCYGRDGEDPAVIAETVRLYRTGLSCAAVGERMGVTDSAVLSRLQKAGEPRRSRGWSKVAA
jgi:hypothetical protein